MSIDQRKTCFVIMGFGKKTDYESGRILDLDASYEAIIQPAVEAAGLLCLRADKIMHSGLIDLPMYEMLLRADLVIADISTGNVNAVYELGVRHALRPRSTIIMKEAAGKLSFDLNHISTLHYEHLGADIGSREAQRARQQLQQLISRVMAEQIPDSPVYAFLSGLQQPRLDDSAFRKMVTDAEHLQGEFREHLHAGEQALRASEHRQAAIAFAAAAKLKPDEPAIIQKLALATYKSQWPTAEEALTTGLSILSVLNPDGSNDPETLGIAGAMHKRLWQLKHDRAQLDAAIRCYGRGFELMRDYYNGENLATCYAFRADIQTDPAEATYDRMSAQKVRKTVIALLTDLMALPSFVERSDQKWIHATLANCHYALGNGAAGDAQEHAFNGLDPAGWEIETFKHGKHAALQQSIQPASN